MSLEPLRKTISAPMLLGILGHNISTLNCAIRLSVAAQRHQRTSKISQVRSGESKCTQILSLPRGDSSTTAVIIIAMNNINVELNS